MAVVALITVYSSDNMSFNNHRMSGLSSTTRTMGRLSISTFGKTGTSSAGSGGTLFISKGGSVTVKRAYSPSVLSHVISPFSFVTIS